MKYETKDDFKVFASIAIGVLVLYLILMGGVLITALIFLR
jgi:hypothetical protein